MPDDNSQPGQNAGTPAAPTGTAPTTPVDQTTQIPVDSGATTQTPTPAYQEPTTAGATTETPTTGPAPVVGPAEEKPEEGGASIPPVSTPGGASTV